MKNKIHPFSWILGFTFCCVIASCNGGCNKQKKISFQFNLAPGATYRYIIKDSQEVNSFGGNMSLATTIEAVYQKIKDSESVQIIKSTIDRVAVNVTSPTINLSFDSRSGSMPPSSQTAAAPMFELVDRSFLIYIKKDGTIKKIVNLPSGAVSKPVNDSLLIQAIGKSFDFFPDHAVSVGGQWKTKTQLPVQGMNTFLKTTYTLQSVRGDTAFLKATSDLEAPKRDLVMNQIPITISMKGTQEGTLKVLIPEGRLLQASFSSKITGLYKAMGQEKKTATEGISTISSEKE